MKVPQHASQKRFGASEGGADEGSIEGKATTWLQVDNRNGFLVSLGKLGRLISFPCPPVLASISPPYPLPFKYIQAPTWLTDPLS